MSRGFDHSLLARKNRLVVRGFIIQFATRERPSTIDFQQKTGDTGHPYGPRNGDGAPVSPVCIPVTEVYLPGRSFHPEPLRLADAPRTRHPARSSATTRSS